MIAFGGLLLLGGRLSDLFGARRLFTTGWIILAIGSLVAGLAGQAWVELLGRGARRRRCIHCTLGADPADDALRQRTAGTHQGVDPLRPRRGIAGVFLCGVITEYLSRPWVFYIAPSKEPKPFQAELE